MKRSRSVPMLLSSIESGDSADVVGRLLSAGASRGATTSLGESALHVAARCGVSDDIVRMLLHSSDAPSAKEPRSADWHDAVLAWTNRPSSPGADGDVHDWHPELLAAVVQINSRDFFGRTPLHLAAMLTPANEQQADARLTCCRLLLEAGADPRARTKEGLDVVELAQTDRLDTDSRAMELCPWTQSAHARRVQACPAAATPDALWAEHNAAFVELVLQHRNRKLEDEGGILLDRLTAPSWPRAVGSGGFGSGPCYSLSSSGRGAPPAANSIAAVNGASSHVSSWSSDSSFVLQVCSDLHLEFFDTPAQVLDANLVVPAADNLALLGDICWAGDPRLEAFLQSVAGKFKMVYMIAGNHECYNNEYWAALEWLRSRSSALGLPNLVFLENDCAVVADGRIRLLGCTLWSHVDSSAYGEVAERLNDYRAIRFNPAGADGTAAAGGSERLLTPDDTNALHQHSLEYLLGQADEARAAGQRCVLLLHHAPLTGLGTSNPLFFGSKTSQAFSTDLTTSLLAHPAVSHAFYGHTHWFSDISLPPPYSVRVVSNPLGYRTETDVAHDPSFCVDLCL